MTEPEQSAHAQGVGEPQRVNGYTRGESRDRKRRGSFFPKKIRKSFWGRQLRQGEMTRPFSPPRHPRARRGGGSGGGVGSPSCVAVHSGPSPPTRSLLLALPLSRAPRASLRVRAWQHAGVAAAMRVYQSFAGAIRPASCSASKPSRGREQIGAPPKARAGLSLARAACRCDPFLSCSVVEGVCAQKACRKMRRGGHSAQLRTLAQVRNKRQIRGSARALACAIAA